MKFLRPVGLVSAVLAISPAFAQTTTLNANANVYQYDPTDTFIQASDSETNSGTFGGIANFGPIATSANVYDPNTGLLTGTAYQAVSANIVDAFDGSFSYSEGWNASMSSSGGANVYAMAAGSVLDSTYSVVTSGPTLLTVTYTSTYSDTFGDGFGLWNTGLLVNGTSYSTTQAQEIAASGGIWFSPGNGGWSVLIPTGGLQTIAFEPASNIASSPTFNDTAQMNETLNFSFAAVPETPAPFATLMGLAGVTALFRRRK